MSLTAGTRIGPYEILSTLGAGGMGEVYRARDTRLNRTVAVKAMHDLFAQHPERIARFEREAQLLASLNHPNIAAIHGVEEAQGATFLVLEFVDGRPLSEMLQAGALPLPEALAIADQIAGALAAAHERGIIHRDLKPGNVMVTPDGQVKLLDFGLGKAIESESGRVADPSTPHAQSPTMTMAATQAGIILGTAGYMSPEQAKGRTADKRSDVWAFGCVLFELVTGKRAFDGEDVTEILAAIVRGEPDWPALPASLPPSVRDLIHRCLVRNRNERLADMSVVQFVLNERAAAASPAPSPIVTARAARSLTLPMTVALVALGVVVTAAVMSALPHRAAAAASSTTVAQLAIALPEGDEISFLNQAPVAISRDGTTVAYTAIHDGKLMLFARRLAESEPHLLPGTDGAKSPFFSPNGEWIGFFAQGAGKLRKITVGGTALGDLADAADGRGGAWSGDDVIYFAPTNVSNIMKVQASGNGVASAVTELDRSKGDISHRWPKVLPGDTNLLLTIWSGPGPDESQLVEMPLKSTERHPLLKGGDTPIYAEAGYLLYGRLDGLFAMPWRPGQRELGQTVPLTLHESPRMDNEGSSDYAVSSDGTLIYLPGSDARRAHRIVWADRQGKIEPLPLPEREFESVAISPDGKQAAVQIQDSVIGIWLYDFERHGLTPLAKNDGSSQAPLWSHDGKSIIYRGTRSGYRNIYRRNADGSGAEERLTTKEKVIQTPTSVTPDGDWVLFNEGGGAGSKGSIWRVRLSGDHKVEPVLENGELNGQISPDGKWIAFQTTQDRQSEVYVQPYPGPGARHQVSIGGGAWPLWSSAGTELFYDTGDAEMAADIRTAGAFGVGTPHAVVNGRFRTSINGNTQYALARDGRFLRVQRVQPDTPVTKIEIVLNWFEKLRSGPK
jgi:Tol biopolymer transport system component